MREVIRDYSLFYWVYEKHDKKMADTLKMIQGGQKVENFEFSFSK